MTVDDKGRVGIPAKFMSVWREHYPEHAGRVGIGITAERSVRIMPMPVYEKYLDFLGGLDEHLSDEGVLKTYMLAFADDAELDKQNRIKLSESLLEECCISRAVVITGFGDYLKIFDEAQWREYCNANRAMVGQAQTNKVQRERAVPQQPAPVFQMVWPPPVAVPAPETPAR